jgi:hypothetical protein
MHGTRELLELARGGKQGRAALAPQRGFTGGRQIVEDIAVLVSETSQSLFVTENSDL